jgi:hypothetical protein
MLFGNARRLDLLSQWAVRVRHAQSEAVQDASIERGAKAKHAVAQPEYVKKHRLEVETIRGLVGAVSQAVRQWALQAERRQPD